MKMFLFLKCEYKILSNIFMILIKFIFIFDIIKAELTECPKEKPILKSGECKLEYCSKTEFDSKYCSINNSIVKNQWINNLIIIGDYSYRYINFGTYSNGDMIIETTCYPEQPKRMFYGLKQNGRPFFINKTNNEPTSYYSIINNNEQNLSRESTGTIIKSSNTDNYGKEYFLTFSVFECNVELFDFEKDEVHTKTLFDLTTLNIIYSLRHSFFYFSNTNSNYYYFIGLISYHTYEDKIYLQKHIFNLNNNFEEISSYTNEGTNIPDAFGHEISCYQTVKGLINCFTMNKFSDGIYHLMVKYENDFSDYIDESIKSTINDEFTFYKCIHLKEELGVFTYYYNETNKFYPILLFREFDKDQNKFVNFLSSEYIDSGVYLSRYSFLNNLLINDIIKITETKIVFTAASEDKETLYIIVINIFYENKTLKIRYYPIQLYALYHYRILFDLRLNEYNGFIVLALSFCPYNNCLIDDDEHYSAFMIFSYPNGTDNQLYLDQYLLYNNDMTINNNEIDLKNELNIENNIFGYIYSSILIKEINDCGMYKLYSSKNEELEIIENYIFDIDEKIKIKYIGNGNNYPIFNCKVQYYFTATESDLDTYNSYAEYNEGSDDLFVKEEYTGRLNYYNIILNQELTSICDNNCNLCYKDKNYDCITCKDNFSLYKKNGEFKKKCFSKGFCQDVEDIINNKCSTIFLSQNQTKELYNKIKDYYINNNYNGDNKIIQTKNVIFQISKIEDQKNSYNTDISSIDLGKCEEELKISKEIPEEESLIIYKIDIKTPDLLQTFVQYEIYNPINYELLDLSICKDIKISINAPIILNNYTSSLYDNLKESGYDLFNKNDSFYNDICSPYTTENGTDVLLKDRKEIIYNNYVNTSLCQIGCELEYYNSTSKKAKCNCIPQKNESEIDLSLIINKFNIEMITDTFLTTLKNSNFLVLKCFKLVFNLKNIGKNIGRIFMTIIIFISFIILIIFCLYDFNNINKIIIEFSINKINNNNNNSKDINDQSNDKVLKKKKKSKTKIIKKKLSNSNSKLDVPPKKKIINQNRNDISFNNNDNSQTSKRLSKDTRFVYKNNKFNNRIENKKPTIKINKKNNDKIESINEILKITKKSKTVNMQKKQLSNYNSKKYLINDDKIINHNHYNNLNDQELNMLEYEKAIKVDKRNYFQYYWSLLKKKQILLFTFLPAKDYNLITLKICLFLTSFCLYLTINGFFFNDDTMHKIFEDNGAYNIIFQIPQILYSSIISSIINILLKHLSLSENSILSIKKEENIIKIKAISKEIKKCLTIKFIIFFILNYLLLFFFWYFISCFCAVYINTQIILIKDTWISFGLSMLYPFGLNLLPGLFRIPALRAKKKDKKLLYKISNIVAFI